MSLNDLFHSLAGPEVFENKFNCYASIRDDGLTHHNVRITLNKVFVAHRRPILT